MGQGRGGELLVLGHEFPNQGMGIEFIFQNLHFIET